MNLKRHFSYDAGSIHYKNIFNALYSGTDYVTKILISSLYILSNMIFIDFSKHMNDISLSRFPSSQTILNLIIKNI